MSLEMWLWIQIFNMTINIIFKYNLVIDILSIFS